MSLKSVPRPVEPLENEDLLLEYVSARDDLEARQLLSQLLAQHDHVIKETISGKLGVHDRTTTRNDTKEDFDDVYADTLLRLIDRLHSLRKSREELPIRNFASYLAAIARNSCEEFLRRKHPQRHLLKKRLRYVLTHSPGLGLWREADGEWICGHESWRPSDEPFSVSVSGARIVTGISDRSEVGGLDGRGEPTGQGDNANELRRTALTIFAKANRPISLNALVGLVGEALGINDGHHFLASETVIADPRVDAASELVLNSRVSFLWDEICRLPLRQRIALLFNLRDAGGRSAIGLFPLLQVASMERIACALEMPIEQLAELWNRLPMEDAVIAKHLGITRQQVINLRKSARQRLANRTRSFGQ